MQELEFIDSKRKLLAFNGNILPTKKRMTIETIADFMVFSLQKAKDFVEMMVSRGFLEFDVAGANENDKRYTKYFLLKTGKR